VIPVLLVPKVIQVTKETQEYKELPEILVLKVTKGIRVYKEIPGNRAILEQIVRWLALRETLGNKAIPVCRVTLVTKVIQV
jgi:hypothetical protein